MKQLAAALLVVLACASSAYGGSIRTSPPSAKDFADVFLGVTNAYAQQHGEAAHFARAHCVEAARGRYMCAYATVLNGATRQCHLMQARWTPEAASSITITLVSRTPLCGSLREALASLR
jgi:hypothetical protein